MTFREKYNLLSSVVRIVDPYDRTSFQKLKSLVKLLSKQLHLSSVTIYIYDQQSGYLSQKITSAPTGIATACRIPVGVGGAGKCAGGKTPLFEKPEFLHKDEYRHGNEAEFFFEPMLRDDKLFGVLAIGLGPNEQLLKPEKKLLDQVQVIALQLLASFSSENDKKLEELSLLYRVSNTILSTIELNKLIHLTLTALTSGPNPFFDRAMLFLINKRSGIMQGMLGVTRETSLSCEDPFAGSEDILANRWDISEEDMICQRASTFNQDVMASRLELNRSLNVASKAVLEKRLIYVAQASKAKRVDHEFIKRFGITSLPSRLLSPGKKLLALLLWITPSTESRSPRTVCAFCSYSPIRQA